MYYLTDRVQLPEHRREQPARRTPLSGEVEHHNLLVLESHNFVLFFAADAILTDQASPLQQVHLQ